MMHFLKTSHLGRTFYYGQAATTSLGRFALVPSDALSSFSSALLAQWEGCLPVLSSETCVAAEPTSITALETARTFISRKAVTTCMKGLSP